MSKMTETVSKTTEDSSPEVPVERARKTTTNWRVFEEGRFVPVRWKCEGYLGSHPSDLSCHTNLKITGEDIQRHMNTDHGGGWFRVKFRLTDGKPSPIWRELEEAGVELQDLYCPHCRQGVGMSPREIYKHLQPHAGANRVNMDPQVLAMTLSYQHAERDEFDALYEVA